MVKGRMRAIARSRRPIVLSLSPGTGLSTRHLDHLRANAQMWRISDDLWDRWDDVYAQFARLARWAPLQEPGGWADADMLPLGRIGLRAERGEPRDSLLTLDEQRTVLTLWVMARSPLMMGGDLPSSDGRTVELLANPWLGRVLSEARDSAEILREPRSGGEHIVWAARSADPDRRFVAMGVAGALGAIALPMGLGFFKKPIPADIPEVLRADYKATPRGKVTVVDFVDFECPFCRMTHKELEPLLEQHKAQVYVVRKNVPLRMHPHAMDAAKASCCARSSSRRSIRPPKRQHPAPPRPAAR